MPLFLFPIYLEGVAICCTVPQPFPKLMATDQSKQLWPCGLTVGTLSSKSCETHHFSSQWYKKTVCDHMLVECGTNEFTKICPNVSEILCL